MGDNAAQELAALAAAIAAANRPPACLNDELSTQNTTIVGYQNSTVIGLELLLFYNVLYSIHLNNDTIKELIWHGLISLKELTLFSKKDLEKFSKSVLCNKSPVKAQLNLQSQGQIVVLKLVILASRGIRKILIYGINN